MFGFNFIRSGRWIDGLFEELIFAEEPVLDVTAQWLSF